MQESAGFVGSTEISLVDKTTPRYRGALHLRLASSDLALVTRPEQHAPEPALMIREESRLGYRRRRD